METLFIGQNRIFLPQVDSTNSYAMNLLKNVNAPEGTLVYTDNQTHGRGQRGSAWLTNSAENITCSLVVCPTFLDSKKAFYLSKITALAVHDVLAEFLNNSQCGIKIKWPNDIVVNTKKIAGILIENIYKSNVLKQAVIGVGININQTAFAGLENKATSLATLQNQQFDREDALNLFCRHFEKWYLQLKANKFTLIDDAYFSNIYQWQTMCAYNDNAGNFFGKIINILEDGRVVLEKENNIQKTYDIKELTFL